MEKQASSEKSPRAREDSSSGGTEVRQSEGAPSNLSPRTVGFAPEKPDRKPDDWTTTMMPDAGDKNTIAEDIIDRPMTESKPTIAVDECPLEKLKLLLVPSTDDDRRSSPGRVRSGSAVIAVSPASVISGIDEGPFSFSEGDVTKARGSPVQRLLRLTGGKAGSLRFFIEEGSGGSGGMQIASPRPAV